MDNFFHRLPHIDILLHPPNKFSHLLFQFVERSCRLARNWFTWTVYVWPIVTTLMVAVQNQAEWWITRWDSQGYYEMGTNCSSPVETQVMIIRQLLDHPITNNTLPNNSVERNKISGRFFIIRQVIEYGFVFHGQVIEICLPHGTRLFQRATHNVSCSFAIIAFYFFSPCFWMNLYKDKLVGIEGVRDLRSDGFSFGSTLVLKIKRDKRIIKDYTHTLYRSKCSRRVVGHVSTNVRCMLVHMHQTLNKVVCKYIFKSRPYRCSPTRSRANHLTNQQAEHKR